MRTPPSWVVRYSAAVVSAGVALLLTLLLRPLIAPTFFLLFFAAVVLSAWYGGLGPGLLATALAGLGSSYFLVPTFSPLTGGGSDVVRLVVFALVAVLISSLTAAREQARQALQRERDFVKSLVDTSQDAIIAINRHGQIVLFNPAAGRIFGYTAADVHGQKVNMLMPEPYASEHDEYIARYERTGTPRAIGRILSVAGRRKNGQTFPIELAVTKLQGDGEVWYGAFIRDVSEKVRLQEQLIERERLAAIGTTAATFAHEVGNPLNSMSMAAQLLERRLARQGDATDDKLLVPLRTLMSELRRLTLLLHEFRSLARRQELTLRPVQLTTLVAEVLAAEAPASAAGGIRVEQILPPDLPVIVADGEKLRQLLLNLCKNAIEAMPHGGTLTVRASGAGAQVNLEISDTGVGIPAGIDIFAPFVTTKSQRTGLGLTVARQIVTAHQGAITYSSEPGRGTVFRLALPLNPLSWDEGTYQPDKRSLPGGQS
ncbi:MAG: PAS domain S-box protein [Thermodesulfobacteriota bacterium]